MAADATTPLPPPPPAVVHSQRHRGPESSPVSGGSSPRVTWLCTVGAIGAVWRASDQLGLSTWWLGPRGEPNSRLVQLLPFVPAVMMVLAAINHVRHVAWWGWLAAGLIVATGAVDLGRVVRLGFARGADRMRSGGGVAGFAHRHLPAAARRRDP